MAKKVFKYRSHNYEQLKKLSLAEFIDLLPARKRRSIKRGFSLKHKKFLERLRKVKKEVEAGKDIVLRTHCRDMPVLPEMVGVKIGIHNGHEFKVVTVTEEMIGHYLGEFSLTRKHVQHSAPGVGATKSSLYIPLK